jgi:hypothetical protein
MFVYLINLFIDNHFTSVFPFKQQSTFFTTLSEKLTSILPDIEFRTIVCDDGIVIECETPIDNFRGTTFTIMINGVEMECRVVDNQWGF